MSECRGCHLPILWARTAAGRAMPLNPDPDPDGNVEAVLGHKGWSVVAVHTGPDLFGGVRYMPHHATCSRVDDFRPKAGR